MVYFTPHSTVNTRFNTVDKGNVYPLFYLAIPSLVLPETSNDW